MISAWIIFCVQHVIIKHNLFWNPSSYLDVVQEFYAQWGFIESTRYLILCCTFVFFILKKMKLLHHGKICTQATLCARVEAATTEPKRFDHE